MSMDSYIGALLSSQVSVSSLEDALRILRSNKELEKILDNPNVSHVEKESVINDIFVPSVKPFIIKLATDCNVYNLEGIIDAYNTEINKQNNVADAVIYCVTPPDENQIKGIKEYICRQEGTSDANVKIVKEFR